MRLSLQFVRLKRFTRKPCIKFFAYEWIPNTDLIKAGSYVKYALNRLIEPVFPCPLHCRKKSLHSFRPRGHNYKHKIMLMPFLEDHSPLLLLSLISSILVAVLRFILRRNSQRAFKNDPSIKSIKLGRNHYLERSPTKKSEKKAKSWQPLKLGLKSYV